MLCWHSLAGALQQQQQQLPPLAASKRDFTQKAPKNRSLPGAERGLSEKAGVAKPLSASGTFVSPPVDAVQSVLALLGESCFCEGFLGEAELVGGKKSLCFKLESVGQAPGRSFLRSAQLIRAWC